MPDAVFTVNFNNYSSHIWYIFLSHQTCSGNSVQTKVFNLDTSLQASILLLNRENLQCTDTQEVEVSVKVEWFQKEKSLYENIWRQMNLLIEDLEAAWKREKLIMLQSATKI